MPMKSLETLTLHVVEMQNAAPKSTRPRAEPKGSQSGAAYNALRVIGLSWFKMQRFT